MPNYVYKCLGCGKTVEVFHSISEIDNPTEQTIEETTCPLNRDCLADWRTKIGSMELPSEQELRFDRVPQAPMIQGSYGGSILSGAEKINIIKNIIDTLHIIDILHIMIIDILIHQDIHL